MAVTKKTRPSKPAAPAQDIVSQAWQEAMAGVIGLVGVITEAVGSSAQSTSGAQGTTGGTSVEAGQASQATQTTAGHKNDVNAPEATEAYVTSNVQDVAYMGKVNARTFDITSAIATGMLAGHTVNMNQQQANVTTHADEEFSARKRATEFGLIPLGDAAEESADDTDRGS
jgi:hypothetical protein